MNLRCCWSERQKRAAEYPPLSLCSFVKSRVHIVDIFFIHFILGQPKALAEVINLSKSPGTQCLQGFQGFFGVRKNGVDKPRLRNLDVTEALSGNSI